MLQQSNRQMLLKTVTQDINADKKKQYIEIDILNILESKEKQQKSRTKQTDIPYSQQEKTYKWNLKLKPKQFLALFLCKIIQQMNSQVVIAIQWQQIYIISKKAARVAKQKNIIDKFCDQFIVKLIKLKNDSVFYEEIQYALSERKYSCSFFRPETIYWACKKIQQSYSNFIGIQKVAAQYLQALHLGKRQLFVVLKKQNCEQAMKIIDAAVASHKSLKIQDTIKSNYGQFSHLIENQVHKQKEKAYIKQLTKPVNASVCYSISKQTPKAKIFTQDQIVSAAHEMAKKQRERQQAKREKQKIIAQYLTDRLRKTTIQQKKLLQSLIKLASQENFKQKNNRIRILYNIAKKKMELGREEESQAYVNKLLSLAPNQKSVLKLQIDVLSKTNRLQEALKIFQNNKKLKEHYPEKLKEIKDQIQESSYSFQSDSFDMFQQDNDSQFPSQSDEQSVSKLLKFRQS